VACGWLTDRYGVSWQIVPAVIDQMMTSDDSAAAQRAFAAMMDMKKLDIAGLQRAYQASTPQTRRRRKAPDRGRRPGSSRRRPAARRPPPAAEATANSGIVKGR